MGRADQFLGIGAGLALKAAGKAVGLVLDRAAFGGNRALAVLEAAAPNCCSECCRHFPSPSFDENFKCNLP